MSTIPSASEIAGRLVACPTVNPPGNEEEAQRYLASLIEAAGADVMAVEKVRHRPNLVVHLRGRGEQPPLVLHGHVDVVGVEGQEWTHPPFKGFVRSGILHGRGTLDMKSGVAMLVHAVIRAAVDGVEPSGDVVLLVAVDSEAGGDAGLSYVLDEHADVIDGARWAIGEFGGFPLYAFGKKFYRIGVSQKQYAHLQLTLRGKGGHGSRRPAAGTVVGDLGRALVSLDQAALPPHVSPVARRVVQSVADEVAAPIAGHLLGLLDPDGFEEALEHLAGHSKDFEPLFRDTANPTIIRAGEKFNVIPSEGRIEIDARIVPGRTIDDLIGDLAQVLADEAASFEVLAAGPPAQPDYDPALLGLLGSILTELDADAIPIPYMFNESPDGRLFARHGIQHYGFLPMDLPEGLDLPAIIHGPDEHVPLSSIEFGAEALYRLVTRY